MIREWSQTLREQNYFWGSCLESIEIFAIVVFESFADGSGLVHLETYEKNLANA